MRKDYEKRICHSSTSLSRKSKTVLIATAMFDKAEAEVLFAEPLEHSRSAVATSYFSRFAHTKGHRPWSMTERAILGNELSTLPPWQDVEVSEHRVSSVALSWPEPLDPQSKQVSPKCDVPLFSSKRTFIKISTNINVLLSPPYHPSALLRSSKATSVTRTTTGRTTTTAAQREGRT